MSGVSLPVSRPVGRALLVGSPPYRVQPLATLQGLGFSCAEADDPYLAMRELARRPLSYRALILSLSSLYREELQLISAVKRLFPHVEIWLAGTDGRQAALADGMCLGADGLLAEDGLHRVAPQENVAVNGASQLTGRAAGPVRLHRGPHLQLEIQGSEKMAQSADDEGAPGEPVLTADELRALLQDSPLPPPGAGGD